MKKRGMWGERIREVDAWAFVRSAVEMKPVRKDQYDLKNNLYACKGIKGFDANCMHVEARSGPFVKYVLSQQ